MYIPSAGSVGSNELKKACILHVTLTMASVIDMKRQLTNKPVKRSFQFLPRVVLRMIAENVNFDLHEILTTQWENFSSWKTYTVFVKKDYSL